jgi:hypothetical protein
MLFLFFAIASGYPGYSQEKMPKFIITANGGVSIPTGNFAKGNYSDETSGFAKTGSQFNITATYGITPRFGVTALIGYSGFGLNGTQSLSDGYKEDSGTDSTTLYQKGSTYSLSFLVGPSYRFIKTKNIFVDARILIGYVNTHLAGFQIFYESYLSNALTQNPASAGAFGFQAGLTAGYQFNNQWAVQVNGDYFSSKPSIPISYENFIVNSGRKLTAYNQPISGINVTVGVAYSFF